MYITLYVRESPDLVSFNLDG